VNGVGLVSLDDDQGAYYRIGSIAPALQTGSSTRVATTLQLASPPSAGDYGSKVPVSATLTTDAGPVSGATVTFSVGGSTAAAVTDGSGNASVQLPLVAVPGDYPLTAAFDGDGGRVDSADSSTLTIRRLPTTLGLSGNASVADGADTGMRATLAGPAAGLAQRTVAFVLTPAAGGTPVVQVRVTDLLGRASLGPVAQVAPGRYSVQAFFGGGAPVTLPADPVYGAASSGSSQLTVLRTTTIAFPAPATHFVALHDLALPDRITATASSGLLVAIASSTPSVCTVSRPDLAGGVTTWLLQPRSVGTCTLTATQAGDADNAPAQPVTRSFTVARRVVAGPPDGGDIRVAPGATVKIGYDLKIPGRHPAATVSFLSGKAVFLYTCTSGRNAGVITADLTDGNVNVPANSSAWFPSDNRNAASVQQATLTVPDVCPAGSQVRLRGGVLTVGVTSTTPDRMNVRWHYGSSDWSDAVSVYPS
jgi:hypothetical protein